MINNVTVKFAEPPVVTQAPTTVQPTRPRNPSYRPTRPSTRFVTPTTKAPKTTTTLYDVSEEEGKHFESPTL